jgi:hypothetical protein
MIMNLVRRFASLYVTAGAIATAYLVWVWFTPIWKYQAIVTGWNVPIIMVLVAWVWFVYSSLLYHRVIKSWRIS